MRTIAWAGRCWLATVAATLALVASCTSSAGPQGENPAATDATATSAPQPGLVVGEVPVWYDEAGLHHGDVVEQTPVELFDSDGRSGVLALVRTGALYRDPATDDVWFHPWGGAPRVIGHDSPAGPGGDPGGDVAAWFEGEDLVVYDTARDREIARSVSEDTVLLHEPHVVDGFVNVEHELGGNGFRRVTAEEVVWHAGFRSAVYRFDVTTGETSVLWKEPTAGEAAQKLTDVHDATRVWALWDLQGGDDAETATGLRIDAAGSEWLRLLEDVEGIEPIGRLNADGSFVLTPTISRGRHGAAIVEVRSGRIWNLPVRDSYAWLSWSYDDLAVLVADPVGRDDEITHGRLIACDAVTRTCDRWKHHGSVLLPTS